MPNNLTTYILDNGLTVYFYNDDTKHTIHAELVTKYGGKTKDFIYDGKEYHISDGIAHLLEHFLCEHGKAGNFLTLTGDELINSNAVTSSNMTRYYIDGVENMEKALNIMLTNVYNPIFTMENLGKVKKAIFEEIRRSNDRKFFHFNEKFYESLFHKTDFRSVIGTIKEIEDLDLETVKVCYNAFYRPINQFLIIAGNFDKDKYLKQIKAFFDSHKIENHETNLIDLKEPITIKNKYFKVYKETSDTYTSIRYKIDIRHLSPRERLDLESSIHNYLTINFGYSSLIRKKLEDDKIITDGISYFTNFQDDFMICSIGAYNINSDIFIKTIQDEINNKTFNKELFELEIKQTLINFITRFDYLSSIVMPFMENIVTYNYPYLDEAKDFDIPFEKYKKIINSLDFSNYTIGELIDPKYKDKTTD